MFQGKPVFPSGRPTSVQAGWFTAGLLSFIVATRWPLAPKYLYYFDSANFALSLEHFDPARHQPQPPGYALFVLLIRIIHYFVAQPEHVLVIAGLLAAAAATLLVRELASDLFGKPGGLLAAALLVSSPVFWFAGITNQIRLFLAVASLGVSLLAWRALDRPNGKPWFYGACAALGVAAGFRPVESTLLVPLLIWVWSRSGLRLRHLAAGAGLAAVTALPWIAVTVMAVGGPSRMMDVLWSYATVQFEGTSAVFGAPARPAYQMLEEAVVWNLLGPLAWVWAVPMVRWKPFPSERRRKAVFLLLGILPPFLFSAFIHIGDPDQALASASLLSAVGGGVLAALLRQRGSRRVLELGVVVIAIHCLVFFVPPTRLAKASSYKAVAAVDRMNAGAITAIQTLRGKGPITIVHYGSAVASRHLEYYFPDDYVVVLAGSPRDPTPGGVPQVYYRHQSLPTGSEAGVPLTPDSKRVVCLLPYNARPGDLPGWHQLGAAYYMDEPSGGSGTVGPYRFIQ